MSAEYWTVNQHTIPASHIRGFSRGVKDEITAHLRLAVKQYVPKSGQEPQSNAITVIMAHGVGSSKELCEPFFDELLHCLVPIRAIWAMDTAHHGASYLLNEDAIGDEPHWFDSSRDMFQMINYFQEQMPSPIIGIGQSLGAITISMLAVWHPRLFSAIISMEPMFGLTYRAGIRDEDKVNAQTKRKTQLFVNRKDTWSSREAARKHLQANPLYGAYDPRVFERVIEYDLRDVPSNLEGFPAVTLTTPKTMELYTILRADPPLSGFPEAPDYRTRTADDVILPGFHRGERSYVVNNLQHLLPPVLYLWGALSGYANSEYSNSILRQTGIGLGGNGGFASGKVTEAIVEGAYHQVPLEKPAAAAQAVVPWLRKQISIWEQEADRRKTEAPFAVKSFAPEWVARVSKL
ncbi:MAG: hypothetical protein LQ349_000083 [Xanthoria aureola]|nr:MAG: hypothetical protein LQ349_000083 [Xanthoria aureola]